LIVVDTNIDKKSVKMITPMMTKIKKMSASKLYAIIKEINNQMVKIKNTSWPVNDFFIVFSLMLKNMIINNAISNKLAPILIFKFVKLSKNIIPIIIRSILMSKLPVNNELNEKLLNFLLNLVISINLTMNVKLNDFKLFSI